jgi:tetratricopeptide (TPR) repeat protein
MSDADARKILHEDIETALLDADLFLKYKAPQRAIERLHAAIAHHTRSVTLREKLREVAVAAKQPDEAARQCLALAGLYIAREDFESAHERLLEAKQIDPRINIAPGLEAIRRARRPDLLQQAAHAAPAASAPAPRRSTLSGDLSSVSIFDAVQVLENSRLTGALMVESDARRGRVLFNEGRIVGAECGATQALEAFRLIVEITTGTFDFEKSPTEFPTTINAASNTNLILDTLRQLDEESQK